MAPRRGRRGSGSVYYHGTRRQWRARIRWTSDDGRAHARERAAPSREEARRLLAAMRRERDAGRLVDPAAERRLGEHVDAWLAAAATRGVRAHTIGRYRRLMALHVLPALGERTRLRAITPEALNTLYRGLLDAGQQPSSVRLTHRTVSAALALAVRWGHLAANPCARADPPRSPDRERRLLTTAEVRALLGAARAAGDPLLPLWTLAACTGLRVGEATCLRWDDLELTAGGGGTLRVDETLIARGVTAAPKTRQGRRVLRLHPVAVAALAALPRRAPGAFVFARPSGAPYSRSAVSEKLRAALARAGVRPGATFHALRRYAATQMYLASGGDVAATARALGHARASSLAVTLDIYVQTDAQRVDRALAGLGDALAGGGREEREG